MIKTQNQMEGLEGDLQQRMVNEVHGITKPDGIHICYPFSKDTKELFDKHGIKSWNDVLKAFKEVERRLDEVLEEQKAWQR